MPLPFTNDNYRAKMLIVFCLVASLGILSRAVPIGISLWDKYLGDAVYAAVFYLAVSLLGADWSVVTKTLITAVYVVTVEVFQLTGIPAQLNQSSQLLIKLFAFVVLASTFSWWDIVAYGAGIAAAIVADRQMRGCG